MSGDFALCWNNHEKSRTSILRSMFENEEFLDVTIACDDDQIKAHKVVLSASSPFFRNILNRNPHSHPLLYLKGTSKKDIQVLLDFIYNGETQINQEELEEFMVLAENLKISGLVSDDIAVTDKDEEDNLVHKNRATKQDKEHAKDSEQTPASHSDLVIKNTKVHVSKDKDDNVDNLVSFVENDKEISSIADDIKTDENIEVDLHLESTETGRINTLMEYNEKVSELVAKFGVDWICTDCQYTSRARGAVLEHVDVHINYLHHCQHCDKSFTRRSSLRRHKRIHISDIIAEKMKKNKVSRW